MASAGSDPVGSQSTSNIIVDSVQFSRPSESERPPPLEPSQAEEGLLSVLCGAGQGSPKGGSLPAGSPGSWDNRLLPLHTRPHQTAESPAVETIRPRDAAPPYVLCAVPVMESRLRAQAPLASRQLPVWWQKRVEARGRPGGLKGEAERLGVSLPLSRLWGQKGAFWGPSRSSWGFAGVCVHVCPHDEGVLDCVSVRVP